MSDGAGYIPMGGGYMKSRPSFKVLKSCDDLQRHCTAVQDEIRAEIFARLDQPRAEALEVKRRYEFQLQNQNGKTSAVEVDDGTSINIEPAFDFPPL